MSELAEGARLEIVYAPQGYLGFESLSLRHFWRGGRAVECGGLENRCAVELLYPGFESLPLRHSKI